MIGRGGGGGGEQACGSLPRGGSRNGMNREKLFRNMMQDFAIEMGLKDVNH